MAITFDEIADEHVPSVQIETDFESGVNAVPTKTKRLLLLGYSLAASDTYDGIVKSIGSLSAAKTYWGEGSTIAVMAEVALKVAPKVPLYGVSLDDSGGTQASQTITFGSGPATSTGYVVANIGGRRIQIPIAIGDTITNVGDDLEDAINGLHNAPFTASNAAGVVTVTARNAGAAGNSIRIRAEQTNGAGITTTAGAATLASGATDTDPATLLAAVVANDRYHVISCCQDNSTALGSLKTHLETYDSPSEQKWGVGIGASVDTGSNAATITDGLGSYRMQVAWMEESETPVYEIAAAFAALRASKDARLSISGEELSHVKPTYDENNWPTRAELEQALIDGITPIQPHKDGSCTVVRSYIAKNHGDSPSFRDSRIIEISDYVDEYVIDQMTRKAHTKIYKTLSPAGTSNTVTNEKLSKLLHTSLKRLDKLDYIQGVDTDWENGKIVAEQNSSNLNRADLAFLFRPTYTAEQIAIRKQYTTPE